MTGAWRRWVGGGRVASGKLRQQLSVLVLVGVHLEIGQPPVAVGCVYMEMTYLAWQHAK